MRLGDRVTRGQRIAKIEDFEIQEQVKQAEAAQQVSEATIRQREADLKLAQTNAERSRNLFERQLLPKQTLDDNEARYQSAVAAGRSRARAEPRSRRRASTSCASTWATPSSLRRSTASSSRRSVDPGAFVSQNAPVVDVVDISTRPAGGQRRREGPDGAADRRRDAASRWTRSPARCSRAASPACRRCSTRPRAPRRSRSRFPTHGYRLKPGMYARVSITTGTRKDALVVPANAVVDLGGRRGVFTPLNETAVFRALRPRHRAERPRRDPRRPRRGRHRDHHRLLGAA